MSCYCHCRHFDDNGSSINYILLENFKWHAGTTVINSNVRNCQLGYIYNPEDDALANAVVDPVSTTLSIMYLTIVRVCTCVYVHACVCMCVWVWGGGGGVQGETDYDD